MSSVTLTSKGRITIPVTVRTALGIDVGSRIEFVELESGQFMIVPAVIPIQTLKGVLRRPLAPVTIEQMNMSITAIYKDYFLTVHSEN